MLKEATVPKMTNRFYRMWATLAVGPIYWAISGAFPFKDLIMLS